ncbi:hypothetical protein D623_10024760 [Myotis brandtii]|uniref:Uncharacterized protein n=1 Tax=Myotis brandtii TaxID=109478 RepID=S7NU34_MYOBR|nr:hypothetical protein D623_10024760 [Myotis brandtii]
MLPDGFLFSLILKLPSDSFKYLTWHKREQHDILGSQLCCLRVREGPSVEDLLFTQESALPPRKTVLKKHKREAWLQENWEDCKLDHGEHVIVCGRKVAPQGNLFQTKSQKQGDDNMSPGISSKKC